MTVVKRTTVELQWWRALWYYNSVVQLYDSGGGGEDYSVVTGDVRRRTRPACGICENSLKSATIIMIKSYFLIITEYDVGKVTLELMTIMRFHNYYNCEVSRLHLQGKSARFMAVVQECENIQTVFYH